MSLLKKLGEKGKRTAVGLAMLGAVGAGGAGLSGCSTYWEATAPLWELHPEILQPGGYKDYKRKKKARQQVIQRDYTPTGLLTYNEWIDFNNNGAVGASELIGLGKRTFNIDRENMTVAIVADQIGETTFRSYNSKGELIGETVFFYQGDVRGLLIGPNSTRASPPDFMDRIKDSGPGEYRITATLPDGTEYSVNVRVLRDNWPERAESR